MNLIVSVIIPTAGLRPNLLTRSVESALAGFTLSEVEVVIVPNGPEPQWRDAITKFEGHPAISIDPIVKSSANAARNHGLAKAKGLLVRFLDDDDFLIPEVAVRQCQELLASMADVSSYAIRIEDESGQFHQTLSQPKIDDFVSAQLGTTRLQLPHAHVYKKSLISSLLWNEAYIVSEDIAWLHTIACQMEVCWIKSDEVVGIWFQHANPRLSYAHSAHEPNRITAQSIFSTMESLEKQGRMNDLRKHSAIYGLWLCVHRGFFLRPFYWHGIAKKLFKLEPNMRPQTFFFNLPGIARINPLLIEWLLLPLRYLIHCIRCAKALVFGWNPVRRL